ncbi:MAG: nicotinate-nicotinamide nucleotide adenylyltransferase [Myxococcales bacterium]|nr:nicotinate-nicotinamide nucleotide adenylyltransferase [Myxococcales bacterium]
MADRARVAVFGGSFDPPHLGHALATLWMLSACGVDEVVWVPTYVHAFGKALSSFDLRVDLCRLATQHLRGVVVSEIEREIGGESRTIRTLDALAAQRPGVQLLFAVGSDLVPDLPRFERWPELRARYELLVIPRGDRGEQLGIPNVSSSSARAAAASGDDLWLASWLDRKVGARWLAEVHAPGRAGTGEG